MCKILTGTMYIITTKGIYRQINAEGKMICCNPGMCMPEHHLHLYRRHLCCSGRDSSQIEFSDINSVSADLPGNMCNGEQCWPTTKVVLGVPQGSPMANAGATKHQPANKTIIYVEDAEKAMKLIRDTKAKSEMARNAPPVQMAMPLAEDPLEQIKKLAGLRDAGVISESEFQEKKDQLMAKV